MSKPFRKRNALVVHEMHYGPNMTPMVDVVMVILIFFMSSTAILGPEWFLRTSLPKVETSAAASERQPKRVNIRMRATAAGTRLDVDDRKDVAIEALAEILRSMLAERSADELVVPISPEPGTPYADVVRVHEICERMYLKKYGLLDPAAPSGAADGPGSKLPEGRR